MSSLRPYGWVSLSSLSCWFCLPTHLVAPPCGHRPSSEDFLCFFGAALVCWRPGLPCVLGCPGVCSVTSQLLASWAAVSSDTVRVLCTVPGTRLRCLPDENSLRPGNCKLLFEWMGSWCYFRLNDKTPRCHCFSALAAQQNPPKRF